MNKKLLMLSVIRTRFRHLLFLAVYASYFGYDAKGELVALLTNFDVIDWNP